MVLIRLDRGEEYFDKVVEVTEEEYAIMHNLNEKFGVLFDARMTDEQKTLIYEDIKKIYMEKNR